MLPLQEFFSKQVLKFTPKSDGWRGGELNKQNKLYWYF